MLLSASTAILNVINSNKCNKLLSRMLPIEMTSLLWKNYKIWQALTFVSLFYQYSW